MSGKDRDRLRNRTVSFRVSPEEHRQLQARIAVSGLPKGKFIVDSVLYQKVNVTAGKFQSDRLSLELRRLRLCLDNQQSDTEEKQEALQACKALLQQLFKLLDKPEEYLNPNDCVAKVMVK